MVAWPDHCLTQRDPKEKPTTNQEKEYTTRLALDLPKLGVEKHRLVVGKTSMDLVTKKSPVLTRAAHYDYNYIGNDRRLHKSGLDSLCKYPRAVASGSESEVAYMHGNTKKEELGTCN